MSVRLNVGDAVLVNIKPDSKGVGVIKYIGGIHCDITTEYVGIELTKKQNNGHNGTIAGCQYFASPVGFGFHTKLSSVIRKMLPSELVTQLREAFTHIEKLENKMSHHHFGDIAMSSKRTSLISGVSGYLPRRESHSLSLTTIAETFMMNKQKQKQRESSLHIIDETGKKQTSHKSRRRQRHTAYSIHSVQSTHSHSHSECTSSESECSSSSEYSDDDDDDEYSSCNTVNSIRVHVHKVNQLKDRRQIRRHSDSIHKAPFYCPKRMSRKIVKKPHQQRRNNMEHANTNMQHIRNNMDTDKLVPDLPHNAPVLMRIQSSPAALIYSNNCNTSQSPRLYNGKPVLLDPPSCQSPTTFYASHTNQSSQASHSFNQFMGLHSHSNQSSTTITVPDLWGGAQHHAFSSSSMTPHTPQRQDSETQTIYFDPEAFINQRNQMLIQQQQQQQQMPPYNVVSIKYNPSHSAVRSGHRTNVPSLSAVSSPSSNMALYGDSMTNQHYVNQSKHNYNKMYHLSNNALHRTYRNNRTHTLSK